MFAEEFIAVNGIDILIDIIQIYHKQRNIQSYCLTALAKTMIYLNALEYLKHKPMTLRMLYNLLFSKNVIVLKHILYILNNFVDNLLDGYKIIHECARIIGDNNEDDVDDSKMYHEFIYCINTGDLDVKKNSLCLIHSLLDKSDQFMKERFCNIWKESGLLNSIWNLKNVSNSEVKQYLLKIHELISDIIGITQLDIWVLKSKNDELKNVIKQRDKKILKLTQNQKIFNKLSKDLMYYYTTFQDACQSNFLLNTPRNDASTTDDNDAAFKLVQSIDENKKLAKECSQQVDLMETELLSKSREISTLERSNHILSTENELLHDNVKNLNDQVTALEKNIESLKANACKETIKNEDNSSNITNDEPKAMKPKKMGFLDDIKKRRNSTDNNLANMSAKLMNDIQKVGKQGNKDNKSENKSRKPKLGFLADITAGKKGTAKKKKVKRKKGGRTDKVKKKVVKKENNIVFNKKEIKPNKKMKCLHWNRIIETKDNDASKSLWNELKEPTYFDVNEFENLFAVKQKTKVKKKVKKTKKKAVVRAVLDTMRAQHLGILLSSLPPLNVLKACIIKMNENELSIDLVRQICDKFPTLDEIKKIERSLNGQKGMIDMYGKPEQYCMILNDIPNVKLRLESWIFMDEFNEKYDRASDSLKIYIDGCKELKESHTLKQIIGLILQCGNYMNGGTNKGRADGFDIKTFERLEYIQDANKQYNLLKYIALLSAKHIKTVNTFIKDELSNVVECSNKSNLVELRSSSMKLVVLFKKLERSLDIISKNESSNDNVFSVKCQKFIKNNAPKVKKIETVMNKAIKEYENVVKFYREKFKLNESNQFMKIFALSIHMLIFIFYFV